MSRDKISAKIVKNDVHVQSWDEFVQELYNIPCNEYGRYRSRYVYRGVGDSSWHLVTSLQRLGGEYVKLERAMLRSFRKYAKFGEIPRNSTWIELAIAQHHGLPTRLLDWTVSPQVAAHFATGEDDKYDRDAAIWCVDAEAVHRLLPGSFRKRLEAEHAYLFSVEMLESLGASKSLDDFDSSSNTSFAVFFEPPSLDDRIVNQGAILSVMPDAEGDLTSFLVSHPSLYKRIVIPAGLKWEIRDKLDQDYVTERTLFPGLDGLCRWLKRYYGPGPMRELERDAEERDAGDGSDSGRP